MQESRHSSIKVEREQVAAPNGDVAQIKSVAEVHQCTGRLPGCIPMLAGSGIILVERAGTAAESWWTVRPVWPKFMSPCLLYSTFRTSRPSKRELAVSNQNDQEEGWHVRRQSTATTEALTPELMLALPLCRRFQRPALVMFQRRITAAGEASESHEPTQWLPTTHATLTRKTRRRTGDRCAYWADC